MKLSEFEERLAQVSGEKLLHMLEKARREGPEVAFKLIQAEAARRGLEPPVAGADASSSSGDVTEPVFSASWADTEAAPGDGSAVPAEAGEAAPGESPAPVPTWLSEEQSSGLHPFFKVILLLGALGGAAALFLRFFRN